MRWNSAVTHMFPVKCGVQQGGVLSPWLFDFSVDDLIIQLESSNAGWRVRGKFFGCIMYADDLCLFSTLT